MIPERCAPFFGIYAATPAPLTDDYSLDEANLRTLLTELAAVPGLSGFLVNGHAGENPSMPLSDQRRVAEIAAEAVGDRTTVISGVNVENSLAAAAHARDLEADGHVVQHAPVRQQPIVLEDHRNFPTAEFGEFLRTIGEDVVAVKADLALRRLHEPDQASRQGGFTTSRETHYHEGLAGFDAE